MFPLTGFLFELVDELEKEGNSRQAATKQMEAEPEAQRKAVACSCASKKSKSHAIDIRELSFTAWLKFIQNNIYEER